MRKFPLNSVSPELLANGKGCAFVQLPPDFGYVEVPCSAMSFGQAKTDLSFAGALVVLKSFNRDSFKIHNVILSNQGTDESHIEFTKGGHVSADKLAHLDVYWTNNVRDLITRTFVAKQLNALNLLKFRPFTGYGIYFTTTCELSATPAYVYSVDICCKSLDLKFTVYCKATSRTFHSRDTMRKFLTIVKSREFSYAINCDDNWEVTNPRVRYMSLESTRQISAFGNEWFDFETGDLWATIDPELMK